MIDRYVDPARVEHRFPNRIRIAGLDESVGAKRAHPIEFLPRRRRRDRTSAQYVRELDRCDADTAGRSGDEDRITRLDVCLREHSERRHVCGGERCGRRRLDRLRQRYQSIGLHCSVLRETAMRETKLFAVTFRSITTVPTGATGLVRTEENAVPGRDGLDLTADRRHGARDVDSHNVRQVILTDPVVSPEGPTGRGDLLNTP